MADKNIQMTQRSSDNTTWDNLYPKTKASNVMTNSGSDVETCLAEKVSQDDYTKIIPYAVATGSANTYAVTLSPAPIAYGAGMAVTAKINIANTGASTLNINSLGAIPIKKANGNDVTSGNLKLNGVYTFRYDGTNFILQGEGGEYGTATAVEVLSGYTLGTENGLVNGLLSLTGTATVEDVISGKTFYSTDAKSKLTGALSPPFVMQAGDTPYISWNDNSVTSTTPTKVKSATLNVSGKYRISFKFHNQNGSTSYGQIYKNGVAYGIKRTVASGTDVQFTEDLDFNAGDEIALYFWSILYATWYSACSVKVSVIPPASYVMGLNN